MDNWRTSGGGKCIFWSISRDQWRQRLGFDATISSTVNISSWEIGLALQQIPNTILTPIVYTFELGRYAEMMIIKNFKINPEWKLKSGLRTIISRPDPQFQLDNRLQYKNIASLLFSSEGLNPKSISMGLNTSRR